jgi:hypothetical protein
MSHKQQIKAIQIIKKSLLSKRKLNIMEIGSYNVNGTIKNSFEFEKYFGIDLSPGPNVDIVGSGHEIDLLSEGINLCISSECFEHNPFWKETLENMAKHLTGGGYIVITSAINGRLEHGTFRTDPKHSPGSTSVGWSYYKNIEPTEFSSFIKGLPGYRQSFIYTQCITFDLYAVILIGKSTDYEIDARNLEKLKELAKLDISIKGLLFQLWLFPMRIIRSFLSEENYLSIGVRYERITKGLVQNMFKKSINKFQ